MEEPLVEPTPTDRSLSSRAASEINPVEQPENKRRRTSRTRVQRQVDDIEEAELRRLSRIASQTIRQMDREERERRNRSEASSSISPTNVVNRSVAANNQREEDIEASLDRDIEEGNNGLFEHLSFFEVKPQPAGKHLSIGPESSRALRKQ